jgi:hypothetical protein
VQHQEAIIDLGLYGGIFLPTLWAVQENVHDNQNWLLIDCNFRVLVGCLCVDFFNSYLATLDVLMQRH